MTDRQRRRDTNQKHLKARTERLGSDDLGRLVHFVLLDMCSYVPERKFAKSVDYALGFIDADRAEREGRLSRVYFARSRTGLVWTFASQAEADAFWRREWLADGGSAQGAA